MLLLRVFILQILEEGIIIHLKNLAHAVRLCYNESN